ALAHEGGQHALAHGPGQDEHGAHNFAPGMNGHTAARVMPFGPLRRTHENPQVFAHGPGAHFTPGMPGGNARGRHQLADNHSIPRPGAFANPRRVGMVRPGRNPSIMAHSPGALAWRSGASIPRAGGRNDGRAGIFDPGGYIRSGKSAASVITPDYM